MLHSSRRFSRRSTVRTSPSSTHRARSAAGARKAARRLPCVCWWMERTLSTCCRRAARTTATIASHLVRSRKARTRSASSPTRRCLRKAQASRSSRASILYARPDTVGRFTDLPILMWYEVVPTAKGRQFRYSVIFTNEDGGTATDRLMATWGRTTDIEYVYGAEVDAQGRVIAEEFQGPGHEVPAFRGRHEGSHPLMWVSTDNNMVSESGPTEIRYAPAPERFDLTNVSREVVMDRHPWSYTLAAEE